jgi:hypothetical protein
MKKDEVLQLGFLREQIIRFVGENLANREEGEYLLKCINSQGVILDIKTNHANLVSINEYPIDDALMDYKDEIIDDGYVELEVQYEGDDDTIMYNDTAGFIIKDGVLYTLYFLEEGYCSHILIAYTNIEDIHTLAKELKSLKPCNLVVLGGNE